MISEDDVRTAYRLFLGREAESEDAVRAFQALPSLNDLRQAFIACDEFQNIAAPYRENLNRTLLADSSMNVELSSSTTDLARIESHIGETWKQLGEFDPFWSVLSSEQFRAENFANNSSEFYRSAEDDLRVMDASLNRCQRQLPATGSCFEFGCGVGRVTAALANRFSSVMGYDISPGHLRLAAEHLSSLSLSNVTLQGPRQGVRLSQLGTFDFVFSIIVLQHNPPPVILHTVEEFCKMLNPGGLAYFQVPTYRSHYDFSSRVYFNKEFQQREIEMHALPQQYIFEAVYTGGCSVLEVREDNLVGLPSFISNTFLIEKAK